MCICVSAQQNRVFWRKKSANSHFSAKKDGAKPDTVFCKRHQSKKITALGMVKSNLDVLAPCVLKSSESFFLESILGKRNSIEKQVAKPSEYDGFATPRKQTRVL